MALSPAAIATTLGPWAGPGDGDGRRSAFQRGASAYASNIADIETGIGGWTDADIMRDPGGQTSGRDDHRPANADRPLPGPVGPRCQGTGRVSSGSAAVRNEIRSEYSFLLRQRAAGRAAGRGPSDTVAYGAYLAGPAGHCMECHSPPSANAAPAEKRLGAGGYEFHGPWGVGIGPNITPKGLGSWSD